MSLRGRVDRLEDACGGGLLWDGATLKDLTVHGYLDPDHKRGVHIDSEAPVPRGVERAAVYAGLRITALVITAPPGRFKQTRQDMLDLIGLRESADDDTIFARLIEL